MLIKHEAKIVFLGIVEGKNGSQCEVAGDPEEMLKLASLLRNLADKVEETYRSLPHTETE